MYPRMCVYVYRYINTHTNMSMCVYLIVQSTVPNIFINFYILPNFYLILKLYTSIPFNIMLNIYFIKGILNSKITMCLRLDFPIVVAFYNFISLNILYIYLIYNVLLCLIIGERFENKKSCNKKFCRIF